MKPPMRPSSSWTEAVTLKAPPGGMRVGEIAACVTSESAARSGEADAMRREAVRIAKAVRVMGSPFCAETMLLDQVEG